MGEPAQQDLRDRYHGMLVDVIGFPPNLLVVMDQAVGPMLYYHLVDNRTTATEIIRRLNR